MQRFPRSHPYLFRGADWSAHDPGTAHWDYEDMARVRKLEEARQPRRALWIQDCATGYRRLDLNSSDLEDFESCDSNSDGETENEKMPRILVQLRSRSPTRPRPAPKKMKQMSYAKRRALFLQQEEEEEEEEKEKEDNIKAPRKENGEGREKAAQVDPANGHFEQPANFEPAFEMPDPDDDDDAYPANTSVPNFNQHVARHYSSDPPTPSDEAPLAVGHARRAQQQRAQPRVLNNIAANSHDSSEHAAEAAEPAPFVAQQQQPQQPQQLPQGPHVRKARKAPILPDPGPGRRCFYYPECMCRKRKAGNYCDGHSRGGKTLRNCSVCGKEFTDTKAKCPKCRKSLTAANKARV
jgi:hypothetical protein